MISCRIYYDVEPNALFHYNFSVGFMNCALYDFFFFKNRLGAKLA